VFSVKDTVQPGERGEVASEGRDERTLVPSVNAACRLLAALADSERAGETLSELARELDLSKSSAHNILKTLQAWGYVQRETDSRRFRLGAALVELGRAASSQLHATSLVRERLPVLAGEHGLTFAVAQVTGYGDAQVIDRSYPESNVHVGLTIGGRYGHFDGAIGKCLLAALDPDAAAEAVRSATIPRHTDRTIVDPDELLADIDAVRRRGWAASAGELKENRAVAAPLHNADGAAELILFAVGFPGQLDDSEIPSVGAVLRETARAIEIALGGKGDAPSDDEESR
jgi:IclR family acetate operon transcriptional repressor